MSRTAWVSDDVMSHVLAALMRENRLAIITSMLTGLRIGDVLSLRSSELQKERFTVTEQKTLKKRTIRLPSRLRDELLRICGKIYVFEHRTDPRRHRSRQAVYKDIRRAARAFRIKTLVAPHSARKIYAVKEYKKDFNIKRVQALLNHSNEAVTLIYALADQVADRGKRKSSSPAASL